LHVFCIGCFERVCHFQSSFKIGCEPVCSIMSTSKYVFLYSRVPLLTSFYSEEELKFSVVSFTFEGKCEVLLSVGENGSFLYFNMGVTDDE
jgi:hypothetical protein